MKLLPRPYQFLSGRDYPEELLFEVPLDLGAGPVSGKTGLWTIDDLVHEAAERGLSNWRGQVQPRGYATGSLPSAAANPGMFLRDTELDAPVWSAAGQWTTFKRLPADEILLTVGTGGDYATLNEAIVEAMRYGMGYTDDGRGRLVRIRILSGHVETDRHKWVYLDMRHIEIEAEDAEVSVDGSGITYTFGENDTYDYFLNLEETAGPLIRVRFRLDQASVPAGKSLRGFRLRGSGCTGRLLNPSKPEGLTWAESFEPSGFVGFELGAIVFDDAKMTAYGASFADSTLGGIQALHKGNLVLYDCLAPNCRDFGLFVSHSCHATTKTINLDGDPNITDFTFNGYRLGDWRRTPLVGETADDIICVAGGLIVQSEGGNNQHLGGTNIPINTYVNGSLIYRTSDGSVTFDGKIKPEQFTTTTLPTPEAGVMIYLTDTDQFAVSDGTDWYPVNLGSAL
jgi:hypothetical protein